MKRPRQGITLIELTVALSLASLLMIGINGVMASIRKKNQNIQISKLQDVHYSFRSLFWNDLSQARACCINQGALWIELPGAIANDNEGKQLVAYKLIEDSNMPQRLVRQESILSNGSGPTKLIQQTVFWNVVSLEFARIDPSGSAQPIPSTMGPTPKAIRYKLELNQGEDSFRGDVTVR